MGASVQYSVECVTRDATVRARCDSLYDFESFIGAATFGNGVDDNIVLGGIRFEGFVALLIKLGFYLV
jgi:hypothetical protein